MSLAISAIAQPLPVVSTGASRPLLEVQTPPQTGSRVDTSGGDAAYRSSVTRRPGADLGEFSHFRQAIAPAGGTPADDGLRRVVANIDITALTDTDFDRGVLNAYISAVDDALQELSLSGSVISAARSRVEGNREFVKNLVEANNRGIGQLVDADLNEESSKLKALQVQEQLAIQALGIANASTQNVMRLFD